MGSTAISVGGSRVQIVFPGWLLRGRTAERAELAAPLVSRGPGNPYRGQYPRVQVALPARWRHPHGGPALVWSNTCSPTDRAQEPINAGPAPTRPTHTTGATLRTGFSPHWLSALIASCCERTQAPRSHAPIASRQNTYRSAGGEPEWHRFNQQMAESATC
jgi:hypothetical protein